MGAYKLPPLTSPLSCNGSAKCSNTYFCHKALVSGTCSRYQHEAIVSGTIRGINIKAMVFGTFYKYQLLFFNLFVFL